MNRGNEWLLADPQQADQSSYYWLASHASFYTRTESAYYIIPLSISPYVALFSQADVRNQFLKQVLGLRITENGILRKFKFAFTSHLVLNENS